MSDREKRKLERFSLKLPGQISVVGEENQETLDFVTRDICAGGAFFHTENPLPIGTLVKIDLVLSLKELKKLEADKALIKVTGAVIRTDENGMAIYFDESYKISPFSD